MTFKLADELLTRRASGDVRSPAADQLEMRLVGFARGLSIYEMPGRFAENGMLVALAETAMNAAATTAVPDHVGHHGMRTLELRAEFHEPLDTAAGVLRAEAVVVRSDGRTIVVEADVLSDGRRVASFEGTSGAAG